MAFAFTHTSMFSPRTYMLHAFTCINIQTLCIIQIWINKKRVFQWDLMLVLAFSYAVGNSWPQKTPCFCEVAQLGAPQNRISEASHLPWTLRTARDDTCPCIGTQQQSFILHQAEPRVFWVLQVKWTHPVASFSVVLWVPNPCVIHAWFLCTHPSDLCCHHIFLPWTLSCLI